VEASSGTIPSVGPIRVEFVIFGLIVLLQVVRWRKASLRIISSERGIVGFVPISSKHVEIEGGPSLRFGILSTLQDFPKDLITLWRSAAVNLPLLYPLLLI